jgi:hypothetical protein
MLLSERVEELSRENYDLLQRERENKQSSTPATPLSPKQAMTKEGSGGVTSEPVPEEILKIIEEDLEDNNNNILSKNHDKKLGIEKTNKRIIGDSGQQSSKWKVITAQGSSSNKKITPSSIKKGTKHAKSNNSSTTSNPSELDVWAFGSKK